MLPYQNSSQEGRTPRIAIVGLGGAGANILHCFAGQTNAGISLSTMALDERVGHNSGVGSFLQLGEASNHGLGSGGDPAVGAAAAEESEARLMEVLKGLDLLVLVTGLGGGTGSGAAPVIARLARESGVFLVVVATLPFSFEGARRRQQAEKAMAQLSISANVLLCFENDHMEELLQHGKGVHDAFAEADQLLAKATAAVPMLASSPGLINLGLDELKQVLRSRNARCIFGSGSARGIDRARRAAERALESPLLAYRRALSHAGAVLVHIAGGESLSLDEIRVAMDTVTAGVSPEADIFFGTAVKPRLGDELRITLLSSVDPEELAEPPAEPGEPLPAEPDGGDDGEPTTGEGPAPATESAEPEPAPLPGDEAVLPPAEPGAEGEPPAGPIDADAWQAAADQPPTPEATAPRPLPEEPAAVASPAPGSLSPADPLPEPEPVLPEKEEPVLPAKKTAARAKAQASTPASRTRWIQSSFLPEETAGGAPGEVETAPGPEDLAQAAAPASPQGMQYEFDLDSVDREESALELDNEDLDVPPALRSEKWNSMFPEE